MATTSTASAPGQPIDASAPASRRPALPPGPRLPRAAQTAIWSRRAQWMLRQCQARFGDTFTLRIAYEGTWVVLCDPGAVKQVFKGDPRLLHAGEGNRILAPVLGEHSLLLLDEDAHMEQRRLLLPPFHGERMKRFGELMREIAIREISSWPLGRPYRLRPRMQALTLEVILQAVLGVGEGERLEQLRAELRGLLDIPTDPRRLLVLLVLGPRRLRRFPPFRHRMERIDELIYAEIAARRRASDLEERTDILSMLLAARHADGTPMSDRELRDELLTLLVAGHETTATALAWAAESLARHPPKLARLREEVAAGKDVYLDAVITETLRLRPVVSLVARKLVAPMEIGGALLPAGVTVTPCIYLVHRRPDVYPEPDRFLPERFLEAPPGTYTWIPFGGGVRRCLGGAFAQFEMQVVLRELVARRTLRPARRHPERVTRRGITETPSRDAELVLG